MVKLFLLDTKFLSLFSRPLRERQKLKKLLLDLWERINKDKEESFDNCLRLTFQMISEGNNVC